MTTRVLPRYWLPHSLVSRVLLVVLALMLLGGALVALTSWRNGTEAARQSYDRILLGAAHDIAESIQIEDGVAVIKLPVSAFDLLAQAPDDRISYAVRGPSGELITGYEDTPSPQNNVVTANGPIFFDGSMQGETARFVVITRRFAERDLSGVVSVTVGQTLRARQAMALDLTRNALIPVGIVAFVLMLASYFLVRSAMQPLENIATDLLKRDPYDLTPIDVTGAPTELGVSLSALNRFMGRLDRQIDAMRTLISDTAHQLRTPVTAIRVQAESIVEEPDSENAQVSLGRLVRRTRTLGTLLDQLLSRALVVHRTDSATRTLVDLRNVALEILESRDHEIIQPQADIELVIGEDEVLVRADEFSLTQAAKNLFTNALKHGTAPVRIGTDISGNHAILWVEDSGPGPDADLAPKLGKRFTRTASSKEDSAGIGLSIVVAVAEAFDGRFEMEKTSTGFRASLILPLATGGPA